MLVKLQWLIETGMDLSITILISILLKKTSQHNLIDHKGAMDIYLILHVVKSLTITLNIWLGNW